MTTMSIELPDETWAFVAAQAEKGGYASPADYIQAVILDVRRREVKKEIRAKIIEGLNSGPSTPMTREDWDMLERRVWERHSREMPQP